MKNLIIIRKKKTFIDDGQTIDYYQYYLTCNNVKVAIRAVYEGEKSTLLTLYKLQDINNYKEETQK